MNQYSRNGKADVGGMVCGTLAPEKEVVREMHNLRSELNMLEGWVTDLVSQLAPVLRDPTPQNEQCLAAPQVETALGKEIRVVADGVGDLRNRIKDVYSRLEV